MLCQLGVIQGKDVGSLEVKVFHGRFEWGGRLRHGLAGRGGGVVEHARRRDGRVRVCRRGGRRWCEGLGGRCDGCGGSGRLGSGEAHVSWELATNEVTHGGQFGAEDSELGL